MKIRHHLFAASLVLLISSAVMGQTPYPMLMSLKPVAAQTGQTSEHTAFSRYDLQGAYQVLVSGEGVTGEVVPPEKPKEGKKPNATQLKLRFTVAEDALPGVREYRLATPRGVSTVGQLVITSDAVVVEQGNNDKPDQAVAVSLPATVCGAIEKSEDVDYYKFQVAADTSLSFHVRAMRLQDKIHDLQQHADPIITLRNSAGKTLASVDNVFFGDPLMGYHFEQAGEYTLEIRDVRYQGNAHWVYSLEINDRPFVRTVFPLGVAANATTDLQLVGLNLPEGGQASLTLPEDFPRGPGMLRIPLAVAPSNPVPMIVSNLPMTVETDEQNDEPKSAQPVSMPTGISGRIASENDIDCFAFEAKKGERYSFEVLARRHRSDLDSHLRILDADGKQLSINDDLRHGKRLFADSWIENWKAPADGKYVIEIRDLHLRGGAGYVYFLKATRSEPYFELFADTDKTQLTPGTGGVVFVRVVRKNGFKGTIQLQVAGLPKGVTADCGRILANGNDGCIMFQAAADTPLSVADIEISGTAISDKDQPAEQTLSARAEVYQETYMPGGGRGHWPVQTHTLAVGGPHNIRKVTLSTNELTLAPGESQKVEITLERAKDFKGNITLDALYRHLGGVHGNSLPKGITLDEGASKTLLTGTNNKGVLVFKAAANAAEVEKQQVAVMANVSINFVMKATYCSQPLLVTVKKP